MVLSGFERRLERFVEGAFAKAFRSGLQPIEIGRRIARAMDSGRSVGVRGLVVPNHFRVLLSTDDSRHFESFALALARELAGAATDHARTESYHFVGPVVVELVEDTTQRRGVFDIHARIEQAEGAGPRCLVLPGGRRVAVTTTLTIGRMADCAVHVQDPQVSRHHAEIRTVPEGHVVVDLGSSNGTMVNGITVTEHLLTPGDTIVVGDTALRYEAGT